MGRHVRVGHGRGRHVLLGQGRLRHHVRRLGHSVQWRVGVHIHGLLLARTLGRRLLLTGRRSLAWHPLLAGPARSHLVLTGVAGRHPVVVRSHHGHPRLSPRASGSHLVLTWVSRGHPVAVARLAHHGHPLLSGASRPHLVLTWMTRRHPVVVPSHPRHPRLAGRHHMLTRSHPRSHGSLAWPHPGHSSSHWHSDIAHRHLLVHLIGHISLEVGRSRARAGTSVPHVVSRHHTGSSLALTLCQSRGASLSLNGNIRRHIAHVL